MTRINIIKVEDLYDQHLMAEYREIQHIPKALQRSLNKKEGFSMNEIPSTFTLGKGHVKFFYNKGLYLNERYKQLVRELQKRQFSIIDKGFRLDLFPTDLQNGWEPTEKDMQIVKNRIKERVNLKINWYKKTLYV